jgi:hypothetical protein
LRNKQVSKIVKYGSPEFIAVAQGLSYKYPRQSKFVVIFAPGKKSDKLKAAKYVAFEARKQLQEINANTVVTKYIGETEKNLNKVFEDARARNALLLFDEADSLFEKRSNLPEMGMNKVFIRYIRRYKSIVFLSGAFDNDFFKQPDSLVDLVVEFRDFTE